MRILTWLTLVLSLAAGPALVAAAAAAANTPRPNILFILADDLGYGDVGCYNPESKVPTPNLDRLAKEGLRFTDAHSPSTVCTPTRYSIMTGRMAFRLNYRGVFTGVGGPGLITADRLTLPAMLRKKGYETALFGKWHIGMTFSDRDGKPINKGGLAAVRQVDYSRPVPDAPVHRGFDHFFGTVCCPTTDWLYAYMDGDRIPVPPTEVVDKSKLPSHEWSFDCRPGLLAPGFDLEEVDMVFLEKSLQFLDAQAESIPKKPFFLFHSLQAVHLPSFPGKDFKGKTEAGPHGDFIFEFDYVVGELLKRLEKHGFAENTLVIVTSDNGPEVGTVVNMRDKYQHDGARPWRGMKRDNWEGGHRVPLIARWPGKIKAGSTTSQTACLTDLMATCAAIVEASLRAGCGRGQLQSVASAPRGGQRTGTGIHSPPNDEPGPGDSEGRLEVSRPPGIGGQQLRSKTGTEAVHSSGYCTRRTRTVVQPRQGPGRDHQPLPGTPRNRTGTQGEAGRVQGPWTECALRGWSGGFSR